MNVNEDKESGNSSQALVVTAKGLASQEKNGLNLLKNY
jgi:hypothetical protein